MDYRIYPPEGILEATVHLPLSKSISARLLVMNYLTPGSTPPASASLSDSEDTRVLKYILDNPSLEVGNVGAAGTAIRFLTALYAATPGKEIVLDGIERMRQRPIGPLVDALRGLGARIEYLGQEGFPPLRITGKHLEGGDIDISATVSSQFISALMMVAPMMTQGLAIHLKGGTLASAPYVLMTAGMLRDRGVEVAVEPTVITVSGAGYPRATDTCEPDWSAATFWYGFAAVTAGWVTLPGLRQDSCQGDSGVAALFEQLGVVTEFTDTGAELSASPEVFSTLVADMSDMPDAVPAVAVTAALTGVPFRLSGVDSLRVKECDRLEAVVNELLKLGIITEIERTPAGEVLVWEGTRAPITRLPEIETYGDHRIAMAFAIAGAYVPGLVIKNIEVVSKSYPGFWKDMEAAGFVLEDASTEHIELSEDDEQ